MAGKTRTDRFREHVRAAAGIYRRMDAGTLTGRNADSTAGSLRYHIREAAFVLGAACGDDADPLPEYLDSPRGKRLAETWSRVERRYWTGKGRN